MADRGVNEQDFDEYDPTPYSGGYDQVAFYGRPKPPSDETCYPLSARPDCSDDYSHGYGGTKAPYRPAFGGRGGGYVDEGRPTFQPDRPSRPSRPSYGEENEGFGDEAHSGYGRPPVPAYHAGVEEHGSFGSGYGGEVHSGYGRPPVPAYHAGGEEHGSFGSGYGGEVHSGYGRPPVPAYHAEEEYGRRPNPYGHNEEEEEGFGGERPSGRPYGHARPPPQEEPYHEEPPKPFGYGEEENRYQSSSHYVHIGRKKSGRSDSSGDEEEEKKGYGHGRRPHGYGETEEGSGGFQGYSEEDGSRHKHHHWGHHNDD